jgi:ribosomal 50S subunit-recycling heat shock protein
MTQRNETRQNQTVERMRLDKWLWVARFFKTRQLAIEAINGGKVHVNGQRTKPGKEITVGTELAITKERCSMKKRLQAMPGDRKKWPVDARNGRWAFPPTADRTSGSDVSSIASSEWMPEHGRVLV